MTTRALNAMFDENVRAAKRREALYEAERKEAKRIYQEEMFINAVLEEGLDCHAPVSFVYCGFTNTVTHVSDWVKELEEAYDWECECHAIEDDWMYPIVKDVNYDEDVYCNFDDEDLEF